MDFVAGARVLAGTRVALIAEVDVAGCPARCRLSRGPEGTVTGSILTTRANRRRAWLGSGRRTGRLTFRLDTAPGVYTSRSTSD